MVNPRDRGERRRRRKTSSVYHVQHVVCYLVGRDCNLTELKWHSSSSVTATAIILALFDWLKLLTDEGREETEVNGEDPQR